MTTKYIHSLAIFLLSIHVFSSCQNNAQTPEQEENPTYKIIGQVDSIQDNKTVILAAFNPIDQSSEPLDTTEIQEDGSFSLEYPFQHADLFRLKLGAQSVMLAIDKGQNEVTVNAEGKRKGYVNIKGSTDSEKLQGYEAFRAESLARLVTPTYAGMREAKGDPVKEVAAVQAYGHASEEHRKELIDYTTNNIGTSVALFGTVLRWTGDDQIPSLDALVSDFKKVHPNLPMTQVMEEKLARFKAVAIGVNAPSISLPDSTGTMQNLNELLGKYTLIDFWASWCSPCLLQVPDLKEAYNNYHEKGFEIIGISVDSKEKRWKSAIRKYDMNWPHLSDLKGWKSKASEDYNVTFIPFNMLLDENGKIIAKNLHSNELQDKLNELLE